MKTKNAVQKGGKVKVEVEAKELTEVDNRKKGIQTLRANVERIE